MKIGTGNIGLLVIDMQNGFLNDRSRHVVEPVGRLVRAFEARGLPVVFTAFFNEPGGQYERLIGWTRLRESPETDIVSDLQPHATVVVDKTVYGAFTSELEQLIQREGWDTVVLCGVATDGCVLKSAVDAFERGLTPIVVTDACSSHAGEEIHAAGLRLLGRFIGRNQLTTMSELIERLDERG